jgi:hypothetical protein
VLGSRAGPLFYGYSRHASFEPLVLGRNSIECPLESSRLSVRFVGSKPLHRLDDLKISENNQMANRRPNFSQTQLFGEWFATIFNTFGVALITWAAVALAMWDIAHHWAVSNRILIWPIQYTTAIWLIACLFPLTSTFYLVFDLRLRRNQIQDAAERAQLQFVYFPSSDSARQQFSRLLRLRFRESCQPWELAAFSLAAGGIAFVGACLVYWGTFKFPSSDANQVEVISAGAAIIFAAFSGSLAGACIFIFNKFRTFDLYPSTYLQAIIGFVSGTLGATFVGSLYSSEHLRLLAFAVGFLTSTNVSFLGNLLRRQVAQLTGVSLPADNTGDLDSIISNSGAIESLHNISIYSISELVKAEPLIIYLSLPVQIGVINGWIDEALVKYYFSAAKADLLASFAIRRFTQLMELAIKTWPPRGGSAQDIVWNEQISLLSGSGIEQVILYETRCIVDARIHNRLLGILSDRYRVAFFPVDVAPEPNASVDLPPLKIASGEMS